MLGNAKNGDPENGNNVMHERPEADDIDSYDNLTGVTFLLDPLKSPDNVATKATVIRRKTNHLVTHWERHMLIPCSTHGNMR